MTEHFTSLGHLRQAQMDEANRLGVTHMEYIDIVLARLAKENTEKMLQNNNKLTVKCKNPYIVVGHGPEWEKQATKLKNTKIPIISTDVSSTALMDLGVIPKYIITYEEAFKKINEKLFDFDRINKHNIQVIGSPRTRQWLELELDDRGLYLYRYDKYDTVSNVGLFSCLFAEEVLKTDRLILIGMNSWDGDKGNPYLEWYMDWLQYINRLPDGFLINCTKSGLLYGDKILDCDFDNLVVEIESGNI